jgi:hypothetical protein
MIMTIMSKVGVTRTATRGILNTFVKFLKSKHDSVQVDYACVAYLENAGHSILSTDWMDFLDIPITAEELKAAVFQGASKKALGSNGVCLEFFKANWDCIEGDMLALINQMYLEGRIMEPQKHGTVVCIPKTSAPNTPVDYKPITLLNTDYKILARIVANRLRPTLSELLHPSQYCGVLGKTIFDVVATTRDAIAYVELTHAHYAFFLWTLQRPLTGYRILIFLDGQKVWI